MARGQNGGRDLCLQTAEVEVKTEPGLKSQSSGNQQVAMVKVVYVSIPKEFRKPDGVLTRDLADKLNVTGEEENVDLGLKALGGIDTGVSGALAMIMSVRDGKVQGMKYVIRGAKFGSTVEVARLWAGADKEVKLKVDVDLSIFQFPGGGDDARNNSAWLDMSQVEWEMVVTSEDGQETPLTAAERETRGLQNFKFALRATVMADCKGAKVYVSIIPVGAKEVRGKISAWGVEMSEFSEKIPSLPLVVRGMGNPKKGDSKYATVLMVGPLERPGDGVNIGWLPMLDFGEPEEGENAG